MSVKPPEERPTAKEGQQLQSQLRRTELQGVTHCQIHMMDDALHPGPLRLLFENQTEN